MKTILKILFLFIALIFASTQTFAVTKNGFDLSNSIISEDKILSGGPSKDGIPSINNPKFIDVKDVNYLKDDDIIIGLDHNGIQKAYPTRILVWHEIANDTIDTLKVAVTYCPLCGTAMVFDRYIDDKLRSFGVSGLLYQSDVLMYDRETNSLWSQLAMKSVSGKAVGSELKWLPSQHLTWKAWKTKYPNSKVLSLDTGYNRNYNATPYGSYINSDDVMFPVPKNRDDLSNKTWVVGVIIDGVAKAYDVNKLPDKKEVKDKIGKTKIIIKYDKEKNHPSVTTEDKKEIASVLVYWFAWQAFYPDTELWK
jgi:hypothetical protein